MHDYHAYPYITCLQLTAIYLVAYMAKEIQKVCFRTVFYACCCTPSRLDGGGVCIYIYIYTWAALDV